MEMLSFDKQYIKLFPRITLYMSNICKTNKLPEKYYKTEIRSNYRNRSNDFFQE